MKCPTCDYTNNSLTSLSIHFRSKHKSTSKQLFLLMNCEGKHPTCKCGCGEETRFYDITRGFADYQKGHYSRVHNNWGHNQVALDKSHATTRELYKTGQITTWNKGETKETDVRVAAYGKTQSDNFKADEAKLARYSKQMKKSWEDGSVKTLYGPAHSQWSGGTSGLSAYCHGNRRLYNEWKFPKLQASGFKCSRCQSSDSLCVHHDGERMADVIRKIASDHGYIGQDDEGLKSKIAEAVAEYHVSEQVSGAVLCYDCHRLEHANLNFPRPTVLQCRIK